MIFLSSKVPLSELPSIIEGINQIDWFLFSTRIRNKDYAKDFELYSMYNRLLYYPYFYKDKLYNYFMSEHYYSKSNLHQVMYIHHVGQIINMKKVKRFEEISNWDEEIIKQEDRLFREKDVERIFIEFKNHNFRENPICEYVLG